ncbi:MAG: rhamnulokinase family protein [Lachnospiraceae bacterium]
MKKILNLVAFDCGNSSVRTLLCKFDGEKVESELVLQEPNGMIEEDGFFYWDMENVFAIMKKGLGLAAKKVDHIDSAGICTWGVDFLLLDENEKFIQKALSYRNTIGAEVMDKLSQEEQKEMFYRTGILCDKINSIYMLKGMHKYMPEVMRKAKKLLMVPDVFVYMFTGVLENEPSELSTTQMMDVLKYEISPKQCEYAEVSTDLFSEIGQHGKKVGNVKEEILAELGIEYDIPVICVPSHDTACAVHAIPSREESYLFVSSGTWSLIGAQIPEPIINEEVLNANLTNEVGAFGRTTLLRNSAGMFITQRLKEEYEKEIGEKIGWNEFTDLADTYSGEVPIFDVNDIRFFNPKCMVKEIWNTIHAESEHTVKDWPEVLASTYRSLGQSYAQVSRTLIDCTKREYDKVYVVGGGCKNRMIIQTFADEMNMPIMTCDMECASVGNAVAQIAYFHPEYSYGKIREIVADSLRVKEYLPSINV